MALFRLIVLLAALTALFLGIGYVFVGTGGMLLGLGIALLTNFFAYWFSDKIVLRMYGAKPYSDKKINAMLERIARKANIPTPPLYFVDMSVPNAFATGRDTKHAAVAVTKGLTDKLNDREVEAVLAHEIGHVKNKDTLIATMAATIAGAISWFAYAFYYGDNRNRNALSFVMLFFLAPLAATLIRLAISRSRELSADATGARLSNPIDLASALHKIAGEAAAHPVRGNSATSHLFIVNPFSGGAVMKLFSTHPPVEERIARLKSMK